MKRFSNFQSHSPLQDLIKHISRFLTGGVLNTLLSYAVFLILNQFIGYQIAYGIGYAVGIIFSYFFNSKLVFEVNVSWKTALRWPLVYVVQYLVSAVLLGIFVEKLSVPDNVAPLAVIIIMTPVTYVMMRMILKRKSKIVLDESST